MDLHDAKPTSSIEGYVPTVVAVLYHQNEVCLVQKAHWPDYWDFVQGSIELGDRRSLEERAREGSDDGTVDSSVRGAVYRELKQELCQADYGEPLFTGIVRKRLISASSEDYYDDQGNIGKLLLYLAVPLLGPKESVRLEGKEEHGLLVGMRWEQPRDAQPLLNPLVQGFANEVFYFMEDKGLFLPGTVHPNPE